MDNNMDRMQLMKEIGEASFMVNDLTLYLDTHPTDQEALKAFSEASKKRRELMEICADQFEPLTMDLVCPDTNNQSRSLTNTRTRSTLPGQTDRCHGKEALYNVEL